MENEIQEEADLRIQGKGRSLSVRTAQPPLPWVPSVPALQRGPSTARGPVGKEEDDDDGCDDSDGSHGDGGKGGDGGEGGYDSDDMMVLRVVIVWMAFLCGNGRKGEASEASLDGSYKNQNISHSSGASIDGDNEP